MLHEALFRVFVVDDETVIATTLTKILENHGYQATCFTEATKALEQARIEKPDLVLSDVMMPGLSGVELAIAIKSVSPRSKVLLMSGQSGTSDIMQSARDQGHQFMLLDKPVHPVELLQHIQSLATK